MIQRNSHSLWKTIESHAVHQSACPPFIKMLKYSKWCRSKVSHIQSTPPHVWNSQLHTLCRKRAPTKWTQYRTFTRWFVFSIWVSCSVINDAAVIGAPDNYYKKEMQLKLFMFLHSWVDKTISELSSHNPCILTAFIIDEGGVPLEAQGVFKRRTFEWKKVPGSMMMS